MIASDRALTEIFATPFVFVEHEQLSSCILINAASLETRAVFIGNCVCIVSQSRIKEKTLFTSCINRMYHIRFDQPRGAAWASGGFNEGHTYM